MSKNNVSKYNPNYPYKKQDITIDMSKKLGYPLVERTTNALLFPEGPQEGIDTKGFEEKD